MARYHAFPADPEGLRELRALTAYRAMPVAESVTDGRTTVPSPRASAALRDATDEAVASVNADVVDLVTRAQQGDTHAFGSLYDRYVDLVYRYIYYRVNSAVLAEDLVSETFLRALRRIATFTWQGKDFGAWLVTIARNLIADHFKSSRYKLEVPTGEIVESGRVVADGPENEVLNSLTNMTLLEAVKLLNAEQQECVTLRFLNGLSVTETALAMGKTDGAIKALQYRAVQSLKRLLPAELVL